MPGRSHNRPRYAKARRGNKPPGVMNKTEQAFAEYLTGELLAGKIRDWRYEVLKVRLGPDWKTTLTVDFIVIRNDDVIEMIDCKGTGPSEEDARVKIKCAAEQLPWFCWCWYVRQPQAAGGGWKREEFTR